MAAKASRWSPDNINRKIRTHPNRMAFIDTSIARNGRRLRQCHRSPKDTRVWGLQGVPVRPSRMLSLRGWLLPLQAVVRANVAGLGRRLEGEMGHGPGIRGYRGRGRRGSPRPAGKGTSLGGDWEVRCSKC